MKPVMTKIITAMMKKQQNNFKAVRTYVCFECIFFPHVFFLISLYLIKDEIMIDSHEKSNNAQIIFINSFYKLSSRYVDMYLYTIVFFHLIIHISSIIIN